MARSYGELLDALRGATWPARAPVRGLSSGMHAARVRGNSVEFAEYRPYRQGDDPRRLDWRVLARTDRAYVRVTTHRATLPTRLVVDASASMAFPARTHGKWTQACSVAVGLAAVAHGTGDPAGLIVTAERGERAIAPRTRRNVVAGIARLLDGVTPGGSRPLAPALAAARDVSRIVVISDFLDDLDDVIAAARERASAGAGLAGAASATVGDETARAAPRDSLAPRGVLVLGRAGWEEKFLITALEELGWAVSARLHVAPGVDVGQGGATLDAARLGVVVALDTSAALGFRALRALHPDAVPLESRDGMVAVAARRVGAGRVVYVGYGESWRWRMTGDEGAVTAHGAWWSAVVRAASHRAAWPISMSSARASAAPYATTVAAFGEPVPARAAPRAKSPGGALRSWMLLVLFAMLLAEWTSRRLRGAT